MAPARSARSAGVEATVRADRLQETPTMSVETLLIVAVLGCPFGRPVRCAPEPCRVVRTICRPVCTVPCQVVRPVVVEAEAPAIVEAPEPQELAAVVDELEVAAEEIEDDIVTEAVAAEEESEEDDEEDDDSVLEFVGFRTPLGFARPDLGLDWGVATIGAGTLYPTPFLQTAGAFGFPFGGTGSADEAAPVFGPGTPILCGCDPPVVPTIVLPSPITEPEPVPEPAPLLVWILAMTALFASRVLRRSPQGLPEEAPRPTA